MSPVNMITDPAAESTESAEGARVITTYINGESSITLKPGMIVVFTSFSGTGAMKVKHCPKTGSFSIIGVVTGGKAPGVTVPPGTLAFICSEGPCKVLVHGHTVAGHSVIINTGTALTGVGKTSATPVLGKTVGFFTDTSTNAGTTSQWMYVHKV